MASQKNMSSPLLRKNVVLSNNEDSPSRYRMKLLSEKWNSIEENLEREKQERKYILESRLYNIQDKINKSRPLEEQQFKILREQMIQLSENIDNERMDKESVDDQKSKEIKSLEENFLSLIDEEKAKKKIIESKIQKQIDEKFFALNLGLQITNKEYEENKQNKVRDVQFELDGIRDEIANERKKRDEGIYQLTQQMEEEINKFHEMLLIEKKVREETQLKIFRMIEEVNNKLENDIFIEKKDREVTTESLLKLLEETCQNIDKNFHN